MANLRSTRMDGIKQRVNSKNSNWQRKVMNIWDHKQWNREGDWDICKECGNAHQSRKCRKCK